jgi:plasmid stabilization system protein ParE
VPVVKRHRDFEADYIALLDSIVDRGEPTWIDVLADGLDRTVRLLSSFPAAGAAVDSRGTLTLRKILFPRGPYLAWYVHDAGDVTADLWLVRLFHARQRRPAPALRRRWTRRRARD